MQYFNTLNVNILCCIFLSTHIEIKESVNTYLWCLLKNYIYLRKNQLTQIHSSNFYLRAFQDKLKKYLNFITYHVRVNVWIMSHILSARLILWKLLFFIQMYENFLMSCNRSLSIIRHRICYSCTDSRFADSVNDQWSTA